MSGDAFSLRGTLAWGTLAILALGAGLGGWSVMARIDGAVIAPAVIEAASEEIVVQHPAGGVVSEVPAREGATVAAGQTLVQLDPTKIDAEIAEADSQYFEYLARRARLEAERAALAEDRRVSRSWPPSPASFTTCASRRRAR